MKISVLGAAGCVGSATAFHIAACRLADELVLLDVRQNVVEHHAVDIQMAVSKLDVKVRAGSFVDIAGSDVIVNAAGIHQDHAASPEERKEMLLRNVGIMREIGLQVRAQCPQAVIFTASNPVDLLNFALWRASGLPRRQIIGYSSNDTIRFRHFVAQVKGVEPSRVSGIVIGEHGPAQVPLFSSVRIDNRPVSFTEEEKRTVLAANPEFFRHIEGLKAGRTAGWTCAVGLAEVVEAVVKDTQALLPGSVVLEGEYGQQGLSIGVPLRLGKGGFSEIVELPLTGDEEQAFAAAVRKIAEGVSLVEEELVRLA